MQARLENAVGPSSANHSDDVMTIQMLLNRIAEWRGGPHVLLDVDGIYGPKTKAAIEGFQAKQELVVDGIAAPGGPTITRINRVASPLPKLNDGVSYLLPKEPNQRFS